MSKAYKERDIWSQLKAKNSTDLKKALAKDPNWQLIKTDGARHFFEHLTRKNIVEIHVHPSNKSGYGEAMLKALLEDIAWTKDDMIALKLIKGKKKKKGK